MADFEDHRCGYLKGSAEELREYVTECPHCAKLHVGSWKSEYAQCQNCSRVFQVRAWRKMGEDDRPTGSKCECGSEKLKLLGHSSWCPARGEDG